MKKLLILLSLILTQAAFAISGPEMLKKLDDLNSLEKDSTARVKLTIQEVGQSTKVQDMLYYRQDSTDSFLIVILSPANEKGNGYLKNKDNMWLYKKNTRTFQFINSDENIGSSDAKADDFEERKLIDDYTVVGNIEETTLGSRDVYKFELKGKNKNVKDPKRIYWVDKATMLPLKQQNFSLSGTLMQTIEIGAYKKIDSSFIATKFLVIDEFEKGNKTLVEISDISTNPVPSNIFTKAYLENLSK